jgi:hypothetical protein
MVIGAGQIMWHGELIPAMLPGLEFSEQGHIYKVNGTVRKSVTGYTGPLGNHDFVQQVDLDWGSTVHDYLYNFDMDTLDFDSPEFDHRFDGYIAGWQSECVKRGWDRKKMLAEYPIYSKKYLYTGRFDNAFETENYDYFVDKKTGQPSKITGLQLAAYVQAAIEWKFTTASRARLVEVCIDKNGKVRTQMFDYRTNWQYFLMAYSLQNYLK